MVGQAFSFLAFDNDSFDVDLVLSVAAAQTVPVPDQVATGTASAGYLGIQTVSIGTQAAEAQVIVASNASQNVPAPTVTASSDVDIDASSSTTIAVPTQDARLLFIYAPPIKAQRYGYEFNARRASVVQTLRRAA